MIILDTNFILACVENKADFTQLEELAIPREVIDELEKICEGGDLQSRQNAEIALKIISTNKESIKAINLGDDFVDRGIEGYIKDKKDVIFGTLDKGLMRRLKGKVQFLSLENRKKFRII